MAPLEEIQIQGYKCIRSIELDLNGINIITGRNNTGKTSVLESIDLALNPSNLKKYESNVGGLINNRMDSITIEFNYLDEDHSMNLSNPDRGEAVSIYTDAISEMIRGDESQMYWTSGRASAYLGGELPDEFLESLVEKAQEEILQNGQDLKSSISDNTFVLEYDGEIYPYIYLARFHYHIGHRLIDNSIDELSKILIDHLDHSAETERIKEFTEHEIDRRFMYLVNEGHFLETPSALDAGSLIRSTVLERDPSDEEDDGAAVKKTEIRDYLHNHDIIPGIQDFDFDEIVVEESNGERYSLDYEYMGDGFKCIIGILWELMEVDDSGKNDIIMLEEPENHMHPGYISELVPYLVQFAEDNGNQLFITTHNLDFLSEFYSDEISASDREFLKHNLSVIQMTETVPDVMDYEQSAHELDDLHKDLRGV